MNLSSDFKHILFCTDFSRNADEAFAYAYQAARANPSATLTILHVIPDPEAQFWNTYLPELDNFQEQANKDIKQRIHERYIQPLNGEVTVASEVLVGKDFVEILEYIKENPVDLVVMGRQGKSEWGSLLFGNVSDKISRHADCAVLIVPKSFVEKNNPSS